MKYESKILYRLPQLAFHLMLVFHINHSRDIQQGKLNYCWQEPTIDIPQRLCLALTQTGNYIYIYSTHLEGSYHWNEFFSSVLNFINNDTRLERTSIMTRVLGQISRQKWENLKKPSQQWLGSFYTTYPEINNHGIFTTVLSESHDESLIYGWSTKGMANPSIFPQYSQTLLNWDILPLENFDN